MALAVTGGADDSVRALEGSTEEEQFQEAV
jgi:hypothetical protein